MISHRRSREILKRLSKHTPLTHKDLHKASQKKLRESWLTFTDVKINVFVK